MKNRVTVIPDDKLIIVDGVGITLEFTPFEDIHAIQWENYSGHCEYKDGSPNKLITINDYNTDIAPYVALWEAEKVRIKKNKLREIEENNKIDNIREKALSVIDYLATEDILAGFYYEIDGEVLHFSYESEDQQNFADTFNGVAMRKLMGIEGLPEVIGWNGWKNHRSDNKGDLVRLVLDENAFLELYTKGALAHKSLHMSIHGERKKSIETAETSEMIINLLEGWSGINIGSSYDEEVI